ncbi:hypothetical protein Cni_G25282 [Canna indica]|uniref:Uncharacterized protein n=1 Tax=Canna indica TaxID=4628 RepID=A0AAQ3KXK4_9LILI|nr:hypothetical protein Cni_G25282 [Canna indica]
MWRRTAEIISQGKEAILSVESGVDSADHYSSEPEPPSTTSSSRLYNKYEMQVISIQTDVSTFSEAPEDAEDSAGGDWNLIWLRRSSSSSGHGREGAGNMEKGCVLRYQCSRLKKRGARD